MKIKRSVLLVLGFTFMILGAIGILLPVIPTTPFMLLAGGCFSKSSIRMENWIKKNKYFGSYINNYQSGIGVPKKIKIKSIVYLWISLLICILLIDRIWVKLLIAIAGSIVTTHIISIKIKEE